MYWHTMDYVDIVANAASGDVYAAVRRRLARTGGARITLRILLVQPGSINCTLKSAFTKHDYFSRTAEVIVTNRTGIDASMLCMLPCALTARAI